MECNVTSTKRGRSAAFTVMERHGDLWLEVRGSEPIPAVGEPIPPGVDPMTVDVELMQEAFRQGARDLTSIWELILAPDTLAEVLALRSEETRLNSSHVQPSRMPSSA